jgi:hypothetical protein
MATGASFLVGQRTPGPLSAFALEVGLADRNDFNECASAPSQIGL